MFNRHFLFYPLLLATLLGALAGNYFLYNKAYEFYQREAAVRIEPFSDQYAGANRSLPAKRDGRPRLIIFGESRCRMWGPYHPENWGDIEIINRGIGGETTPQIMPRLEPDVLALNPDVVLLQMGDNDLKTMAVLPGTKSQTIKATYDNITQMAKTLADQGIEVVITTIFPTGPIELLRKPLWSDEVNESIDFVNSRLLEFEYPGVVVADCDKFLRDGKYIRPEYSLDTLHLTEAGYRSLNEELEPLMKSVVSRARD